MAAPLKLKKVSDVFREFADLLDESIDLGRLTDPGFKNLQRILLSMQAYGQYFLGHDIMPGVAKAVDGSVIAG
jgi:hypothetical protein